VKAYLAPNKPIGDRGAPAAKPADGEQQQQLGQQLPLLPVDGNMPFTIFAKDIALVARMQRQGQRRMQVEETP
jgi:hypothetical protein